MKKIRNGSFINLRYFCIIFVIAFGLIAFVACGGGGDDGAAPPVPPPVPPTQPHPGEWSGPADFGELNFIVDSTSTGITEITFTFNNFTCAGIHNGSIKITSVPPWPIADRQFTIESPPNPNLEMTLIGTFDNTGTNVSGTYEAVSFGTTCSGTWSGTWDGGGGSGDLCAGPVPCLTQDWGGTYYEFHEPNGNRIIITSNGNVYAAVGYNEEGDAIGLGGDVIDCYNGDISEGAIDNYPPDGNIDDWFTSVSGNVNICNTTLRISNLVIEGTPEPGTEATYVGVYVVAVASLKSNENQTGRKIPPEILFEILDKMSSEQ
jgi:hypothetical protein